MYTYLSNGFASGNPYLSRPQSQTSSVSASVAGSASRPLVSTELARPSMVSHDTLKFGSSRFFVLYDRGGQRNKDVRTWGNNIARMSWDAQKEHPIDGVQTRGTNIAIVSAHNIKAVEKYFPTHRYIISESAWNSAKSDLADKTRRARDGVVKVYGTTKKILKWLQE